MTKLRITNLYEFLIWAFMALMAASCSTDDGPDYPDDPPYIGVPKLIVDVDVASSTDDLFALQMAYNYARKGQCELVGVVVDRAGEVNAACVDVMNTYFGYGDVPLGLVHNGIENPVVWIDYSDLPNYADDNGNKYFKRTYSDYSELPDGWELYRKVLSEQPDHSVTIVSLGFLPCLAQLLDSHGDQYSSLDGVQLVRKKVNCIYIMGGVFGEALEPDFNFGQGLDFSKDFFDKWPSDVDIIFSPGEVGDKIEYKDNWVIDDISWTDAHPIKQVYLNCFTNTGQKMWDPIAVIHAIEGDGQFIMSQRGTVALTDQAETIFTPSFNGNCRYEKPGDTAWCEKMLQKIRLSTTELK
ncbi:MAG: nucleoside hydrolase [Bacteroidaceae bacterium]|nr:nucleoside hydrolase [Bacteroidaceae bacterium]